MFQKIRQDFESTCHGPLLVQHVKLNSDQYSSADFRSQWPRGLRRGSAAARLLGLLIQIPLGAWIYVCVVCCQIDV
jgi:hypothetical protein